MARLRRKGKDLKIELLRGVPLFAGCSKSELSRIASLTDQIEVPEGRVLVRQGEPGREFFVIADGTARATVRGRRAVRLGRGDFFGEMALLDDDVRSATVTADSDMQLYVLASREFGELLESSASVNRKVLAALSRRVREAERSVSY